MKILFLAANPVDVGARLRVDREIREISQKIRWADLGDQLKLVSEWAVRADDLQELLMRHRPDVVHFSGHCSPSSGIMLEDKDGSPKVVSREVLAALFRILKGNIRLVVLNACYAKDQAQALATVIDYTIGMNAAIEDKDAVIFAARFYQSLAFGYSVKEAFDLAVNQLRLVGSDVAHVPELLEREGANAADFRIVKTPRSGARNNIKVGKYGINPIFITRSFKNRPKSCFVLMPFTQKWSDRVFQHIKEILAGLNYQAYRADDLYGYDVLEDIWTAINESEIIIADTTAKNPNVFYEIGIAHTLGKKVILLSQNAKDIPFDFKRYRHIIYEGNVDGFQQLMKELPKYLGST